jgi:peroxiredoxin
MEINPLCLFSHQLLITAIFLNLKPVLLKPEILHMKKFLLPVWVVSIFIGCQTKQEAKHEVVIKGSFVDTAPMPVVINFESYRDTLAPDKSGNLYKKLSDVTPGTYFFHVGQSDFVIPIEENRVIEIKFTTKDSTLVLEVSGSPEWDEMQSFKNSYNSIQDSVYGPYTKKYEENDNWRNEQLKTTKDGVAIARIEKKYNDNAVAIMESGAVQAEKTADSLVFERILFLKSPVNVASGLRYLLNDPDTSRFRLLQKKFINGQSKSEVILENKIKALGDILVGSIIPGFQCTDSLNQTVSSSSFEGKYTLIDFWASWCSPCRLENKTIAANFNKYKSEGFQVVSISLDRDKRLWVKAAMHDKLNWVNLSDLKEFDSPVAKLFNIHSLPGNLLLDPSRRIIGKNIRGEKLSLALQKIFKEKK